MRREAGGSSSSAVPAASLEASILGAHATIARDVTGAPHNAAARSSPDSAAAAGPLSPADLAELTRGAARLRALGRALLLARCHGVAWIVMALLALPFAVFEPTLWWLVLLLGCSALSELHGGRLLRAFDPRGPRWLGTQQLLLFGLFALYCGFGIYRGATGPSPSSELAQMQPALSDALGSELAVDERMAQLIDAAYRTAIVGFYCVLLMVSALYQGACAYYYFTRAAVLRAYRNETPAWVARALEGLLGW